MYHPVVIPLLNYDLIGISLVSFCLNLELLPVVMLFSNETMEKHCHNFLLVNPCGLLIKYPLFSDGNIFPLSSAQTSPEFAVTPADVE